MELATEKDGEGKEWMARVLGGKGKEGEWEEEREWPGLAAGSESE
jgi:hypothetical protein